MTTQVQESQFNWVTTITHFLGFSCIGMSKFMLDMASTFLSSFDQYPYSIGRQVPRAHQCIIGVALNP